jgi:hypothetical protein
MQFATWPLMVAMHVVLALLWALAAIARAEVQQEQAQEVTLTHAVAAHAGKAVSEGFQANVSHAVLLSDTFANLSSSKLTAGSNCSPFCVQCSNISACLRCGSGKVR